MQLSVSDALQNMSRSPKQLNLLFSRLISYCHGPFHTLKMHIRCVGALRTDSFIPIVNPHEPHPRRPLVLFSHQPNTSNSNIKQIRVQTKNSLQTKSSWTDGSMVSVWICAKRPKKPETRLSMYWTESSS